MFKIDPAPTFEAPVKIPRADGEPGDLTFVFKHKTRDETTDFFNRATKAKGSEAKLLMEIVAGWKDTDVAFSEAAFERVLQNYPGAIRAIFGTYLKTLNEGRTGN